VEALLVRPHALEREGGFVGLRPVVERGIEWSRSDPRRREEACAREVLSDALSGSRRNEV